MENNTFTYQYSAKRNKEIENIRRKYIPHEESKLERLKRLDLRVQKAGVLESLSLGIVGALVFGLGMCFFLDVFTLANWPAAPLMTVGALLMLPAYPIHRHIYNSKKAELTPEILRLSDEILKS